MSDVSHCLQCGDYKPGLQGPAYVDIAEFEEEIVVTQVTKIYGCPVCPERNVIKTIKDPKWVVYPEEGGK